MNNKIKVLLVEPNKEPKVIEINQNLEKMQSIVGGYIEPFYPFKENIAIICNEEGKMLGLEPNRSILNKQGKIVEIISGTFFICSAPPDSETFDSLSKEQIKQYAELFKEPETFVKTKNGIVVLKPQKKQPEHDR